MAQPIRPRFQPATYNPSPVDLAFDDNRKSAAAWIPLISCPADFPAELFEIAISQLIHHPEYNSTLILRSETVSEISSSIEEVEAIPRLRGLHAVRSIHRKLLPRRPGRDASLEQHCTLYAPSRSPEDEHIEGDPISTLVLTPIVAPGDQLPYYHPTVSHIAFSYVPTTPSPSLHISAVPLPGAPTETSSRLYRTCLALLETVHRYGWGALTSYQKRVEHDRLVSREAYQDLYLVMRERHKHLVETWAEATDPLKHVFEDIGIATFLMLLWKETYRDQSAKVPTLDEEGLTVRPWDAWPRPPGGFLDLGCGNGLLVHILSAEGYAGHGIDLRARQSWAAYPPSTRARLHVHALNPTSAHPDFPTDAAGPITVHTSTDPEAKPTHAAEIPRGCFIIANHADELSPWTPVLATLHAASGFLSIPCCAWSFDERFQRRARSDPFGFLFDGLSFPLADSSTAAEEQTFVDSLALGGDGSHASGYSAYRIWLAKLSIACGWKVECETLRIPSTRNWAIIGRERIAEGEELDARMETLLRVVRDRGLFKTRKPEGKAGEH